jgi:3-isopropylmalate/(R)-2-methylmalate dehydratase small subunit
MGRRMNDIADITGCVHRLGDDVDTDAILPGRYLALHTAEALGAHCLESLDPGFRARVHPGDILVAGRNFGQGSSREHAVVALKAVGIRAIVAASVARIFFRNAINLGLPVLISPDAAAALREGEHATVSVADNAVRQAGQSWATPILGAEVMAILSCGGLTERTRRILASRPLPQSFPTGPSQ